MKTRFRRSRSTGGRQLTVVPSRGETLNSGQAAWLATRPHKTLLPFTTERGRKSQDVLLCYDVDGLVSLRRHLRRNVIGETTLRHLLIDIALVLVWCSKAAYRYPSLLWDADNVYVDSAGHLSFAFIPLDGTRFGPRNSPLTTLGLLADERACCLRGPNALVMAQRLDTYVLGANEAFSLNSYRRFLRQHCSVDVDLVGNVRYLAADGLTSCCTLVNKATGETHPLFENKNVLLGRGSNCQIRIRNSPQVGRRHVVLRDTGEGVLLQDLGSANGTFANDRRLEPSHALLVPYGTELSVADQTFLLCQSGLPPTP